jgi:peptide deformylase
MPILDITKYPTKSLQEPSVLVEDLSIPEIRSLIFDMYETMIDAEGIGIAAPQVGKNIRLFIVRTDSEKGYDVYINPELSKRSWRKDTQEEGCLSVPGHFGPVRRHTGVTISYTDVDGIKRTEKAEGMFARVLQHEYDHIDGILFLDRATSVHPPL